MYQIKKRTADFVVNEILPIILQDTGEFLYCQFEKTNRNTMDVILQLTESLGMIKKHIGISGLKDKNAITTQWMSIPQEAVSMVGGVDVILKTLAQQEGVRVLQHGRYDHPLRIGTHTHNRFCIMLRAQRTPSTTQRTTLQTILDSVSSSSLHIPNAFGIQRFGKGLRNFKRAKKIWEEGPSYPGEYISKFLLSAYACYHFNCYVMHRYQLQQRELRGDVIVDSFALRTATWGYRHNHSIQCIDTTSRKEYSEQQKKQNIYDPCPINHHTLTSFTYDLRGTSWFPTGPLLGPCMLMPALDTLAYEQEMKWYSHLRSQHQNFIHVVSYGVRGRRRPLWMEIQDFVWEWKGDDVYLDFTLPTGSYATVLIGHILHCTDPQRTNRTRLVIPFPANKFF